VRERIFFVFNALAVDTITDFNVVDDVIRLDKTENKIFTALFGVKNSVLTADEFVINTAAIDSNDHIIYNNNTGALFYDADGNGVGAAVKIALIGNHAALTAADFLVI
jgi:Ca2+-binding RTX toxin-like protein